MVEQNKTAAQLRPTLTLHGRTVFAPQGLNLEWSGAGCTLRFCGQQVRICFLGTPGALPVRFRTVLDGQTQYFMLTGNGALREPLDFEPDDAAMDGGAPVLTLNAADDGAHTLELLRVTEVRPPVLPAQGSLFLESVSISGCAPSFMAPPAPRPKRICFIGDSITNGWGVTGAPTSDAFRLTEEDFTRSYAFLTAAAMDAEWSVCAVSGHGVVSHCSGDRSEPMKYFYPRASRSLACPMAPEHADTIVVALGTNDAGGGVSTEEMAHGAEEFLDMLRAQAPDTEIVWMCDIMNQGATEAIRSVVARRRAADAHLHCLSIGLTQAAHGEVGAAGHPNEKGQRRIAQTLIELLRTLPAWAK